MILYKKYIFVKQTKEMNLENTKAQMRKGILELCILAILKEREAYPSEIIERLKVSKLIVVEGTLYPLLTRLKNEELLTYRWEESLSGPPRKYYSITKIGQAFLEELVSSWEELQKAVETLTKN
jgi:PadR family transcriptional regulator, regulatory protein PadR